MSTSASGMWSLIAVSADELVSVTIFCPLRSWYDLMVVLSAFTSTEVPEE